MLASEPLKLAARLARGDEPDRVPAQMACALCGGTDDGGDCERLLFVEPGCWVHLNCAYWSSETRESGRHDRPASATPRQEDELRDCGKWGATIGCTTHRCKRSFHFGCAAAANAVLLADKRLYCETPHDQAGDQRRRLGPADQGDEANARATVKALVGRVWLPDGAVELDPVWCAHGPLEWLQARHARSAPRRVRGLPHALVDCP